MPGPSRQHSRSNPITSRRGRRNQTNQSNLQTPQDSLTFYSSSNQTNTINITFTSDHNLHNLAACPDPDYDLSHHSNHPQPYNKAKAAEEEEEESLNPSQHSFSQALKECQNRKTQKQRPASVDFNGQSANAAVISPRFNLGSLIAMKNSLASSSRSKTGTFPSPRTPNYRYPKGWSSERVSMPTHSTRRFINSVNVLPFNNGRVIPSKWEDAEKWIFSPVGNENGGRSSVPPPHHRRPKSKSGPLGPPAYSMSSSSAASPLNPCFDSGRVGLGGFNDGSPFLAGAFGANRGGCGSANSGGVGGGGGCGGGGRSSSANAEPYILRSASVHGWSDTIIESCSSLPSSQDEKLDNKSSTILRKDVATQMSPDGSTQSSPKARHSFSLSPSSHPIEELEHFSKLEVRDVEVDDRVTVTRWSKKHAARGSDRRSRNIIEWRKKTVAAKSDSSSDWGIAEPAKCISKYKREEAKITAWENLQKAKAEAAIRKLEMKLEKKRSSSMDKILSKLRSAQRKAGEMRSAVATTQSQSQSQQIEKPSSNRRASAYFRKTGQIGSIGGCFTCPAF